jgi:hypothetical protein
MESPAFELKARTTYAIYGALWSVSGKTTLHAGRGVLLSNSLPYKELQSVTHKKPLFPVFTQAAIKDGFLPVSKDFI